MRPAALLEVRRRVRSWAPPVAELTTWTRAALGRRANGAEVALTVVGAAEIRRLNQTYRGKDRPTNVLSFPAPAQPRAAEGRANLLGDLVICARLLRSEARAQGKTLRAHWAHLVVHGALHLIGYDHVKTRDERRMQRREISVLKSLGFANPYRSGPDVG
jgi:probable rRNA maturation factor